MGGSVANPHRIARTAFLLALLGCLAAAPAAPAQTAVGGQYAPSLEDRDGDGLVDGSDCGPDDPSRPSRAGADLDCDGAPDGGGAGAGIGLLPLDGGPDEPEPGEPRDPQAASRPSTGTPSSRAAARDAAGEAVVPVRGLRLGPSVAVYAPARPRSGEPTMIFVAKGNTGLAVTPVLVGAERRPMSTRRRSLPQGRAFVVRLRLTTAQARETREVRFRIAAVDGQGAEHRARHAVPASGARTA